MNSPLVPSVIGNELKMRTLSFQNYTLLTVQSVRTFSLPRVTSPTWSNRWT